MSGPGRGPSTRGSDAAPCAPAGAATASSAPPPASSPATQDRTQPLAIESPASPASPACGAQHTRQAAWTATVTPVRAWPPPIPSGGPDMSRRRAVRMLALLAVRDEMAYLPGWLDNVAGQVDGVVALDDGSADGS